METQRKDSVEEITPTQDYSNMVDKLILQELIATAEEREFSAIECHTMTDEEYKALEEEYKDYDWSKDEEWYSVPEFMSMINEGTIHWDWGGICRVTADGRDSNFHLGIWMSHKENEKSISVTFYDLAERDENIMLEWANK